MQQFSENSEICGRSSAAKTGNTIVCFEVQSLLFARKKEISFKNTFWKGKSGLKGSVDGQSSFLLARVRITTIRATLDLGRLDGTTPTV